jgi:ATF/CREB family transcription factor
MLSGPTSDYFADSHLRGGFPTPNESSLRTGLTPGGGGSMFPQPSPNSQAMFNQLAGGVATPSTLEFHRTAMNAAAVQKGGGAHTQQNITSQPQDMINGMETKPLLQPVSEIFGQHDANDAANGLYMLASQSRNGSQAVNQYSVAQPQTVHAHPLPNSNNMGSQSTDISPTVANRNQSGSLSAASGRGNSEMSDESERQTRPITRGKGKKSAQQTLPTGRRKADDAPSKGPASKKSKTTSGGPNASSMSVEPEPPSDEEMDESKDEYNANGKKMTDEEKRKNFLERNR